MYMNRPEEVTWVKMPAPNRGLGIELQGQIGHSRHIARYARHLNFCLNMKLISKGISPGFLGAVDR